MASREKGGRVVFIGNIPYGVSEEQICDIFARIGQVLSFRLVYDKETGKPKGFGFLEYGDVDAASSAVRNLNGHEIMGRELKVDYSNDNSAKRNDNSGDAAAGAGGSGRAPPPAHFNVSHTAPPPAQGGGDALPQLPPGAPLEPGMTAPDAISRTINAIPAAQLLDILSQMKNLSMTDPAKATQLLTAAPQLGYAIFQALLLLGLIDTNIITSLVQQVQPPPMQQPPAPQYAPPPAYPPQGYPQPPQQYSYPPQGYAPTPPQQPVYQPPPPIQQAPPPAVDGQQQLIQQVLAMSRDDIMRLDDAPRAQIIQLRQQLGAPV